MPKPFSERERELINQRLLSTGQRIFATHGIKKASVEDFTRDAGISKGGFYLFYESKEALFLAVLSQSADRFQAAALKAVEKTGPSPRARLVQALYDIYRAWNAEPILLLLRKEEYNQMLQRLPVEQAPLQPVSDLAFIGQFVQVCRENGIPIIAEEESIALLLNHLFFQQLPGASFDAQANTRLVQLLVNLIASHSLGLTPPPLPVE